MSHTLADPASLSFRRDDEGRLVVTDEQGHASPVRIVRLFPFTVPDGPVAVLGEDGKELTLIPELGALSSSQAAVIRSEIASREFVSVVRRISKTSSLTLPARWDLETDRGPITATLRDEDAFRNLPGGELLITDAGGTRFLVPKIDALDRQSRAILRQHV
jgi:hypothetical protein